jgi:glycosyltransferase involved in cell wall biosynthesis
VKILLVHNQYQQPGGEDVVFDQERQMLERNGHQVITFCRSNREVENYRGLRRLSLAKRTIWASDSHGYLARLLEQEKPEIVHVHNTFVMISPSIYSTCREAGIPVVQTLHNYRLLCPAATFYRDGKICEECLHGSLLRGIEHACYRKSRSASAVAAGMIAFHRMRGTWRRDVTSFIALTEFSRDKFIEGGLPAKKLYVKPNFVHPDPGIGNGQREYALFVGRLSPEKRVSTVLQAWDRISRPIPMLVIGGGPDLPGLKMQAESHQLSQVQFLGQLPRNETISAIKKARFLVFSSEWFENFPVTIAEAFACGTPVVASHLGAMKEIIENGQTGIHFKPGDPDDLAQIVEWSWDHPEELRSMGMKARRAYEAKYTAATNYPLLMNIYQETMKLAG